MSSGPPAAAASRVSLRLGPFALSAQILQAAVNSCQYTAEAEGSDGSAAQ